MSTKLPARFERVLKKLIIEPTRGLARRLREDVPPQTAIRRMEASVHRAGDRLPKEDLEAVWPELLELLKAISDESIDTEGEPPANDVERAVFSAFDMLDEALPFGTIALLTMLVAVSRSAIGYETLRLRQRVADAHGEERALRLKEFAWHIVEKEHVPFLHTLLQASWLTEGRRYKETNSIGDLVNEMKQRRLLGSLLWPQVRHVRNAASHRDGWRPNIDSGMVVLHDKSRDGRVWMDSFEVDELFEKLIGVAAMSSALNAVFYRAYLRDMLTPLIRPLLHTVRTGVEAPELGATFRTCAGHLIHARERMLELGWTLSS